MGNKCKDVCERGRETETNFHPRHAPPSLFHRVLCCAFRRIRRRLRFRTDNKSSRGRNRAISRSLDRAHVALSSATDRAHVAHAVLVALVAVFLA
jgi:hypothetical protein